MATTPAPPSRVLPAEVRVLSVDLDRLPADTGSEALTAEERQRADRFHLARDRARFIGRRQWLRAVLGERLGLPPARVRLTGGPHGKPALHATHGHDLHFNMTHRDGLAVLALATGREVGIDIEPPRIPPDMEAVVRSFWTEAERRWWQALDWRQRPAAFLTAWTVKEAVLKAAGTGLSGALPEVVLGHRAARQPAPMMADDGRGAGPLMFTAQLSGARAAEWMVAPFVPCPGWFGALAVRGPAPVHLSYCPWENA